MFIYTTKFTRKKAIAIVLIIAAILCALVFLAGNRDTAAGAAGETGILAAKGIDSNEDRIAFLQSYGWEVSNEPVETLEVTLPKEFDQTYEQYNALQKSQGFDLKSYAGKRIKRYTYAISNYPTGAAGIQAHLLLYKNVVIGGDVASSELNGFMHGLTMPES